RRARFGASLAELARRLDTDTSDPASWDEETVEDDRLRLIFTCCHPALPPDAQIALTLREVCGLTTEEIARAFLSTPSTVAQRIVRAKSKIRARAHPLSDPVAGGPGGSAGHRAARGLPGVQRGVLRLDRGGADAARSLGRGDPPGAAAGRALAGARGGGAAGVDVVARVPARRADFAGGRAGPAGRPGPLALVPGSDRGGIGAGGAGAGLAAVRALHAAGG